MEWYDLSNTLPPEDENVLVVTRNGGIYINKVVYEYDDDGLGWFWEDGEDPEHLTHWTPLPSPPKK